MILADSIENTGIGAGGKSLEHLQDVVNRYCLSLTGSSWDAEDLAQDTWLKAIETLKILGHTNPEAFLLRIAKNTWIDQSRRKTVLDRILKRERPKVTLPDNGPFEIETAFQALMKHLSPLQRTVFLLRDVFG
jgi:RNA polymerase sigma-70 factor (ECF subfamily)